MTTTLSDSSGRGLRVALLASVAALAAALAAMMAPPAQADHYPDFAQPPCPDGTTYWIIDDLHENYLEVCLERVLQT